MSSRASILDLPAPIILDIFSRLPTITIIHCKCASKSFKRILEDHPPLFTKLHLSRSPTNLLIHQFAQDYPTISPNICKLAELEDDQDHHGLKHNPLMSFDVQSSFPDSRLTLVGSINGLLCFWIFNLQSEDIDGICICNPITREIVKLPNARYSRKSTSWVAYGFGFSSNTNQYKIVRLVAGQILDTVEVGSISEMSEVEIYTLGTGTWRSLGHSPFLFYAFENGVFLNGRLHWLFVDSIRAFDVDNESFEPLSPPPISNDMHSLGLLKSCLCLCDNGNDSTEFAIWVMKEYGVEKSWSKDFVISKSYRQFWPAYEAIAHPLISFKDGIVLIVHWDVSLLSYDPKTRTMEYLNIEKPNFDVMTEEEENKRIPNFELMLYVPSFVSLKDFVGENVGRF